MTLAAGAIALAVLPQAALAVNAPKLPVPSLPVPTSKPTQTPPALIPTPALTPAPAPAPVGQQPAEGGAIVPEQGPLAFAAPATGDPDGSSPAMSPAEQRHDASVQAQEDRDAGRRQQYERQQTEVTSQVAQMDGSYDQQALQAGGGKGQFVSPEAGRPRITQPFGCSALSGEPYNPNCASKHWHTGVDMGGPKGTPIFAADTGVIRTFAGNRGYGNYAIIEHGNHWSTLYGHMVSFAVADRTLVHKGDVIGYEGSTGYSTGPHLHFEVRYQDRYVDPCAAAINC